MINDDDIVRWAYLLGPTFQIENTEGRPLTGGWMEVYIHGTRNKYYCASDFDGTLHSFKIQLDSLGANVVLASPVHSYDIYVYNKFGSLVMSRYNVIPATGEGTYIGDIVTIDSPDNTVDVSTDSGTNWHISIKDTVDTLELLQNEVATAVTSINDRIDNIDLALGNKKDKQTVLNFNGSATKTVKKITQNVNGVISVEYEDIDLPPEVPNVEITSPNGTIDVQSSTDVQTNTKTFNIDVNSDAINSYYIGKSGSTAIMVKGQTVTLPLPSQPTIKGTDIQVIGNECKLKDGLYLVSYNFQMYQDTNSVENTFNDLTIYFGEQREIIYDYRDASYPDTINPPYGRTFQGSFVREISNQNDNYVYITLDAPYNGRAYIKDISIVKLNGIVGSSSGLDKVYHDSSLSGDGTQVNPLSVVSGGNNYTAIEPMYINGDNEVFLDYVAPFTKISGKLGISLNGALEVNQASLSVKVNPSSGIDIINDELVVKVGKGLQIDPTSGLVVIDSEVGDVVETVEKLKQDLDTQITTNFDMPNISQVYDFADPSVSTLANGACMLCQSFTIPINHELRTTTDDADTPTLFGIYAQQNFGHKIMLALYEYTYAAEGEEHGSSTYVGDTGPVNVVQGVNEYPLKNRNPSITELRSDKVYYATLYLPNDARVNGLFLAGAPSYGNQSIPAEPRLSCAVENITWDGQELDMNDPTTTLNHYQEVIIPGQPIYYQYYIGPWQSGYNERQTAPRFYMQIRNGEYNVPVVPTAPFNDLGDALPHGTADQSNIPSFTPSQANSAFRDVTPMMNVTITSFEWIDGMSTCAGWAAANCVYDSGFANNLSGVSNSVVDLGQVVTGEYPGYAHRITFTTPLTLTAGTTYRFLCGCTNGSPYFKVWLDPTDVIHVGNNGWYVVDTNVLRIDHQMGMYNKLYDNNNNHYVI